jgi:hypothetical protein
VCGLSNWRYADRVQAKGGALVVLARGAAGPGLGEIILIESR